MLEFKSINGDSIIEIQKYLNYKKSRTCDSTSASLFMWRDYYSSEYAIYNDTVFMKVVYTDNETKFIVPFGKLSLENSLPVIEEYAEQNQLPLNFVAVPKEAMEVLKNYFQDKVEYGYDRDMSDYLYLAEDLSTLKGRRYSGQRNHMNKFKQLYPDYQYVEINPENIQRVLDFYEEFSGNMVKTMETAIVENSSTLEILNYLEQFKLPGGFIEADGKIIAISVGEIINDTLYVHIEKALKEYPGSYQMIMNEFAKHTISDKVTFINREEDAGDLGLRTSKLSYHPYELLDKYYVNVLK